MEFTKRRKAIAAAFGSTSLSNDGINCAVRCPACDDKKKSKMKLVIRLDDGRYQCWVCGIKGNNVAYLVSKYKNSFLDLISSAFDKKIQSKGLEDFKIELPEGSVFVLKPNRDPDLKAAVKYLHSRGLSKKDIYRWRIMYCSKGKFRRRVLVPSFDHEGSLNYFVARSIDDNRGPKYLNSKVSKNEIVFNELDVDWKKPIVLVEGVFDAIKCDENTIPILGSSLSKKSVLYQALIKNSCDVTLSLDPDLKDKCYQLANNLARDGCRVSIAFAPEKTDLGALDRMQTRKIMKQKVGYDPMNALRFKIKNIKSGSII